MQILGYFLHKSHNLKMPKEKVYKDIKDYCDKEKPERRVGVLRSISQITVNLQERRRRKRSKPQLKRFLSSDHLNNGKISTVTLRPGQQVGITLIQAARDGLLEVVLAHLESGYGQLKDVDEDGYTAFHHAARYNRINVLEALITAGVDVNIKGGPDETTALHMACRYNSGSATQFLLTRGALPNIKDIKGRCPIHYATRRGHDVVTKMLMSAASLDVNAADTDLTTPLIMAAIQGNVNVCELLVTRGADVNKTDINDMTPLMWSSSEGHIEVTKLLIKTARRHGKNQAYKYIQLADNEGNSALHLAVQNGSLEICQILLNNRADVNCQKDNLTTPLHVAATYGFLDIACLLLEEGARVNMPDSDQMTPIHKAALYGTKPAISLLEKKGGDINAKDKKNMSPLHCAAWKGQTDAVAYLLDNGAQIAEVDSSLKTALHWAVQFGHYETLIVLLKHGGCQLLEFRDKNDQTVLHYAAYTGNVSVLKTLLEEGASTSAKDQEERTPLHIAALHDNVNCMESLITASNHELNDDDLDGRTPLLLACSTGHHQAVQVLISLGADVSKRDDEHCTSLMLAAAQGHVTVMKILLENQAQVNDADKLRNSALHYACAGGHGDAVQLLLDRKANVATKNTHDLSPLGQAIDNMHNDTTITMLKHKSWRESMAVRDNKGFTVFDRLIAKLPEGAQIVLDHCMERSSRDEDDPNLTMVFDYQYLDPGPDDPSSSRNRYLALKTMVAHENDALLSHPLCQSLLSQKWVRFGRTTFYLNLLIYLGYLLSLTSYVSTVKNVVETNLVDNLDGCPINLTEEELKNETLVNYYKEHGQMTDEQRQLEVVPYLFGITLVIFVAVFGMRELVRMSHQRGQMTESQRRAMMSPVSHFLTMMLLVIASLFLLRELSKLINQRIKYLLNFFNWIAWVLVISTFFFISPPGLVPCTKQWRAGWIAMFLAWINFIMYLRRIDFAGIYVIMFVTVLSSLLKAVLVFMLFIFAFAGSFYIVMAPKDKQIDSQASAFGSMWPAMVNIMVMTLGEIEFGDNFLPMSSLDPFSYDVSILLVIFIFLMPIVLMNLMIGIAVGDIEKIQRNAYLKRIGLQIDLLYNIENNMPKFVQRKVHVKRATIKPNENTRTVLQKISRGLFASSRNVQFIEHEKRDRTYGGVMKVTEDLKAQQNRIRNLTVLAQQQSLLLHQIASKLNVEADLPAPAAQGVPEICPPFPVVDQVSVYDNMSVNVPLLPQHTRARSVRVRPGPKGERPNSVHL